MSSFSKQRELAERFPPERLSMTSLIVLGGLRMNAAERQLDWRTILESRWFGGYLLGYPHYLDEIDQQLGGAVRKLLFDNAYADGEKMFRHAMGHYLQEDEQTTHGHGTGIPDGTRYFSALENDADAEDTTLGLATMLDIKIIDTQQRIA